MKATLLLPSAIGLLVLACQPTTAESTAGTQASTQSQASADARGATTVAKPSLTYLEDHDVRATREFRVYDALGQATSYREELRADGTGEMALAILEYLPAGTSTWMAPDGSLLASYAEQDRYLIKYRDFHLGHDAGLLSNYQWQERNGTVTVAGETCRRIRGTSRHGFGEVEFTYRESDDLLLGWVSFNAAGNPTTELVTTSLDWTPDHTGVAWSTPAVGETPYAGSIDNPLLGFTPQEPDYLPPGYFLVEERLLLAGGIMSGLGNLHVAMYSDGVHRLFIAQQRLISSPELGLLDKAVAVRLATIGGIGVAEGDYRGRRLYVVSHLSKDEIQTVFGGLF